MSDLVGGAAPGFATADSAFRGVIENLLDAAQSDGAQQGAEKVQGSTYERLGYSAIIENPLARIVSGDDYGVDLKVAVARFVWMISGNNRLADIAFYEPKVKMFTDDDIIVPGSSYGLRMRQAFPGVDQLRGVITRIKQDNATRRAAISVYQPTDATRESKDIPCTFGLMFHAREGRLITQTIMRSNNAWGLLPYNLFEFTLLAELVAAECGLELGPFLQYAGSMHLYERDVEKARALVAAPVPSATFTMNAMPAQPAPLGEVGKLVAFEADLRHGSSGVRADTVGNWISRARNDLHPYWQQFALILILAVVDRNQDRPAIDKVVELLPREFRAALKIKTAPDAHAPSTVAGADLFASPALNVVPITRTTLARRFRELAIEHEERHKTAIGASTLLQLQQRFFDRIAARGADDVISRDEFESALADLQRDQ